MPFDDSVDGTQTVDSFVADIFGDTDSAPASPTPEPGPDAQPAPTPAATESPTPTDGTPVVTAPAQPAAPPPALAPETKAPDPAPVDPFEGAAPLTYTVGEQAKTLDGFTVLKDGTAVIESPAIVQQVQQAFAQVEHLRTANQQLYQQNQSYEQAGGIAALAAAKAELAESNATAVAIIREFCEQFPGEDNKRIIEAIFQRGALNGRVAAYQAREQFGTTLQQATQTQDFGAYQAQGLDKALTDIQKAYPILTADDLAVVKEYLGSAKDVFFRPPQTPDEKQKYAVIIEYDKMLPVLKQQAAYREKLNTDAAKVKQQTVVAEKAATENAARRAAAQRGQSVAAAPQAAPPAPAAPRTRAQDADDFYELQRSLLRQSAR